MSTSNRTCIAPRSEPTEPLNSTAADKPHLYNAVQQGEKLDNWDVGPCPIEMLPSDQALSTNPPKPLLDLLLNDEHVLNTKFFGWLLEEWGKLLEWLFLQTALHVAAIKLESNSLKVAYWIGHGLFFAYLWNRCHQYELRAARGNRLVRTFVSCALGAAISIPLIGWLDTIEKAILRSASEAMTSRAAEESPAGADEPPENSQSDIKPSEPSNIEPGEQSEPNEATETDDLPKKPSEERRPVPVLLPTEN